MNVLKSVLNNIDKFNEIVAKFFAWAMLLLTLTMTYEVISRYGFNKPTIWSYDVSYMLGSMVLIFGMAYTLRIGGHVTIDLIYNRFSRRVQLIMYIIFTIVLFFPLWALMVKVMIPHTLFSWAKQESSWVGTWQPIVYPFKTWVTVGTIMLVLQGTAEFIRDIVELIGGERP